MRPGAIAALALGALGAGFLAGLWYNQRDANSYVDEAARVLANNLTLPAGTTTVKRSAARRMSSYWPLHPIV